MRDHGGDLAWARATFGEGDWIDLSTGINRQPYPVPELPPRAFRDLTSSQNSAALCDVAADAFGCSMERILAVSGAQAAIQIYPRLRRPGLARIVGPTYNEHAASLAAQGWEVEVVGKLSELSGADLGVVVNPNNPDGTHHAASDILSLVGQTGLLVVDESFADPVPEISVAGQVGIDGLLVLRSLGKFFGLAGIREGLLLGREPQILAARALVGPWAVSGPAAIIGAAAYGDAAWRARTVERLDVESVRLDRLAVGAGWTLVGGGHLFRTYKTGDSLEARSSLARHHIWTRAFPWSEGWHRLGLPGDEAEWHRLAFAFARKDRPSVFGSQPWV